jgi:FKBP-type peptidyl-prolyl cis-trans isomerase
MILFVACKNKDRIHNIVTEDEKLAYSTGYALSSQLGPVKNELSEKDIDIIILGLRDGLTFTDSGELKVNVSNYLPNINEWIDNKITKKNMELVTNANQKIEGFKKDGEIIETKSGALIKFTSKNESSDKKPIISNYLPNINEWIDKKITKKNMEQVTNANQKIEDFKKDGEIIETKSGALIKFTSKNESSDKKPLISNSVKVHYEGSLLANGEVFDSSIERGEPITFPLSNVIICWQESLQEINLGSKAIVICPPETAYGEDGAPPVIPPNATLKFKIELLEIN